MPQRQWCDVVFYREGLPLVVVRVDRDPHLIELLERAVNQFLAEVESEYQLLCKVHPR
jgi:hypothetical protein